MADFRGVTGVRASRRRVGALLGCEPDRLGHLLMNSVKNPLPPVLTQSAHIPCQEVVHLASEPDFDIRTLLPARTNTEEYAGPYFTMVL